MKLNFKKQKDFSIELDLYTKSIDKKSIRKRKIISSLIIIAFLCPLAYWGYIKKFPLILLLSFSLLLFYLLFIITDLLSNMIIKRYVVKNYEEDMEFLFNEDVCIDLDDDNLVITEGNNTRTYKNNAVEIYYIDDDKIFLKISEEEFIYIPRNIFINKDHFIVFLDMLGQYEIEGDIND